MFIEVREDFQLVSAHCSLKWVNHGALLNSSAGEDTCDLFSRLLATGCRQNKRKLLWNQNLCFHIRRSIRSAANKLFLFLCFQNFNFFFSVFCRFYEARKIMAAVSLLSQFALRGIKITDMLSLSLFCKHEQFTSNAIIHLFQPICSCE